MAYYTNPYTGQASVIGALQSTQDIIRGLSEGYVRQKQAERESELQGLRLGLEGEQLKAQQTIGLAQTAAEHKRYLRGLERETVQTALGGERWKAEQGIREKELDIAKKAEARLGARAEQDDWLREPVTLKNIFEEAAGGRGTVDYRRLTQGIDPAVLNVMMPRGETLKSFSGLMQSNSGAQALINANGFIEENENYFKSMSAGVIPGTPQFAEIEKIILKSNPYVKIISTLYVPKAATGDLIDKMITREEATEMLTAGPEKVEELREKRGYRPEDIRYENALIPNYDLIRNTFNINPELERSSMVTNELSKRANISIVTAQDFINNVYKGEISGNINFDEMINDMLNQYKEYKKTAPMEIEAPISGKLLPGMMQLGGKELIEGLLPGMMQLGNKELIRWVQ